MARRRQPPEVYHLSDPPPGAAGVIYPPGIKVAIAIKSDDPDKFVDDLVQALDEPAPDEPEEDAVGCKKPGKKAPPKTPKKKPAPRPPRPPKRSK